MVTVKNEKLTKNNYGDKYSEHLFDQFKIYIAGIEKISERRESANKYFLGINSALIISAGFLLEHMSNKDHMYFMLVIISILGLVVAVIFSFLLNSYKQINTGKFEVLHQIEKELPMKLYSEEWKVLGEGDDYKKYYPFSHIEKLIPIAFGSVYFVILFSLIIRALMYFY